MSDAAPPVTDDPPEPTGPPSATGAPDPATEETDSPKLNPVKKFMREVDVRTDIYEPEDYGNDKTNETMTELISVLKAKVRLNMTNPQDTTGNVAAQSDAYNRLGIAYYRLVRFDCAEICHKKHLMLSQAGNKKDVVARNRKLNKLQMKIALVNLGCIFHITGANELALGAYELAMHTAKELEDKPSEALIFANMSNVYRTLCNFESAIECEEKRMDILGEICDVNGQIKCYCSLGSLYQLIGEIRNSLLYYNKAVINLKVKILTLQLEELGILIGNEIGEETGEIETKVA